VASWPKASSASGAALHGGTIVNFFFFFVYYVLVSISPTFYSQLLHQNPFAKKLRTQIVSA
jgi:hypothetical protein